MTPIIEFKDVTKTFGKSRVLNHLNLAIPRGRINFIIGKSGEGKSVTIKHIMGLLKPDSGQIFVDGEDITKYDIDQLREYRKNFGMLFQNAALFDSISVGENVLFPLAEHKRQKMSVMLDRVEEVLTQVGLPNMQHKYPAELSTGQRKRVGLARALVTKPRVILYDEPTTGMDPLVSEMIDQLIVQLSREEKDLTSIVISHDLKAALATGENLMFLYKGKLALHGSAADFKTSSDLVVRQFFSGKVEGPMEFL
ncbi:MAG: ATP-binding cassette domain-containing protein [Deltaproteobacteria bacterium]|nr:ATP-binding cassette domain-containing protein [Deltaproteobacteria bacterium]